MKRIWFAIIFLAITIGFCVGEQIYVKKVYDDLNRQISEATEYEDFEDLVNSIVNMQMYWQKHNDILFSISYQDNLDDLSIAIKTLDPQDDDIYLKLQEVKACNFVFYENQRLSIANVL